MQNPTFLVKAGGPKNLSVCKEKLAVQVYNPARIQLAVVLSISGRFRYLISALRQALIELLCAAPNWSELKERADRRTDVREWVLRAAWDSAHAVPCAIERGVKRVSVAARGHQSKSSLTGNYPRKTTN
jgi:hypothetical protein